MTSEHEWYPQSIDINKIRNISQARRLNNSVFRVQRDTMYISTPLDLIEGLYAYQDPISDEAILY